MSLYEITNASLIKLDTTSLGQEKIKERADLQRLLKQDIAVIDDSLYVIAEEFGDWEESRRRIDLLCIDQEANIVVVELKRDDAAHMELQALRYAAMVSNMSFTQIVSAHITDTGKSYDEAKTDILHFLGWQNETDAEFGNSTRITLVAGEFSKELTTSVMWLNNQFQAAFLIRCIQLSPYKTDDGRLLMSVKQIIPLPEATDYQIKLREKEVTTQRLQDETATLRYDFWERLLKLAREKTQLHSACKPRDKNWIYHRTAYRGVDLNYVVRGYDAQVELYIDADYDETTALRFFDSLHKQKEAIERIFDDNIDWEELSNRRACRLSYKVIGGYKSPQPHWEKIHQSLIDKMIALEKATSPYLAEAYRHANSFS